MQRILVIANKSWEADPLIGVLTSEQGVPGDLGEIEVVHHPYFMRQRVGPDPEARPRIEIASPEATVEVWCIQDLMNPAVSGSSTKEKVRVIPRAFDYRDRWPDLVVAAGTASGPEDANAIGSVVVGGDVFIHDPYATGSRDGLWEPPHPDELVASAGLPGGLFRALEEIRDPAEARFLRPPIQPADPPILLASSMFVDLVNVNITNYDDYAWADPELLERFTAAVGRHARVGALETTLGVVGELSDAPFLFVAGLANDVGRFDYQVTPRLYAQNFVASHNLAVVVAWMIPVLRRALAA